MVKGGNKLGLFSDSKRRRECKEVLDMYHDTESKSDNYRKKCFENSESNNGWYTCARCGRSFRASNMDVDHIIPQSRGGSNSRDNLQLLCQHCNRSKGNDMGDAYDDLKRRRRELRKQDREDLDFINRIKR